VKAYHFLKRDMRSTYEDELPWKVGETRTIEGRCVLGKWGYHSSPTWYDALTYTQGGPIACKVEISKPIERCAGRQVSQTRTLLDCRDATPMLYRFALDCVIKCLLDSNVTNRTLWAGTCALRRWMEGTASANERNWAGVQAYRMCKSSPQDGMSSTAYIVAASLGGGSANFEDPVSIATLVSGLLSITYDYKFAPQAGFWVKRRFAKLMKRLFQHPEGTFQVPDPKAEREDPPPKTESYVLSGWTSRLSADAGQPELEIFTKISGSAMSAPFVVQEIFPHCRVLTGLNYWPQTPKTSSGDDGPIIRLPVVWAGEALLIAKRDTGPWATLEY